MVAVQNDHGVFQHTGLCKVLKELVHFLVETTDLLEIPNISLPSPLWSAPQGGPVPVHPFARISLDTTGSI
jgi:hypothetical protein